MLNFNGYLKEKWVDGIVKRDTAFPIYENPSSKDLIDLKKVGLINDSVRFAAVLSTKKLYVWTAFYIIHDDALAKLTKNKIIPRTDHDNLDQALCGECKLIDGRLSFAQNTGIDSYFGAVVYSVKNKSGRKIDSSMLPLPYFEIKDLLNDLPVIIKRYDWVGKFIDEYETKSTPALLLQYSKNN
jgi:hypothetical protein